MLTDITFWIDLLRERARGERGPANEFIGDNRAHRLSVSVITWGELAAGVERISELEGLLRRITVHFLPLQVAWQAGRIERILAKRGERLGENDNWIAASALTYGLRLVTRDEGFQRVPGLLTVSY